MAKQEMLEVGNNAFEEDDSEFADGFVNGYLYCYDTNHQLSRPQTCQAVNTFMMDNLFDKRKSRKWNADSYSDGLLLSARTILITSLPVLPPLNLSLLQSHYRL